MYEPNYYQISPENKPYQASPSPLTQPRNAINRKFQGQNLRPSPESPARQSIPVKVWGRGGESFLQTRQKPKFPTRSSLPSAKLPFDSSLENSAERNLTAAPINHRCADELLADRGEGRKRITTAVHDAENFPPVGKGNKTRDDDCSLPLPCFFRKCGGMGEGEGRKEVEGEAAAFVRIRPRRLPLSASLLLLLLLLPAASLIRVRSWGRGGNGVKKERIIRELESKRWRDPSGGIMSYALSMSYATSWRRLWIYIPMEGKEEGEGDLLSGASLGRIVRRGTWMNL